MSHTFEYKGWRIHYPGMPADGDEVTIQTPDDAIYQTFSIPFGLLRCFCRDIQIHEEISKLEELL